MSLELPPVARGGSFVSPPREAPHMPITFRPRVCQEYTYLLPPKASETHLYLLYLTEIQTGSPNDDIRVLPWARGVGMEGYSGRNLSVSSHGRPP